MLEHHDSYDNNSVSNNIILYYCHLFAFKHTTPTIPITMPLRMMTTVATNNSSMLVPYVLLGIVRIVKGIYSL